MTTRDRSAPSASKTSSWSRPDRRLDRVGRDREPGPAGGPGGGSVDPLLARRDPRLVRPDLADDPGPDPGLAHALGRLADDLVGERFDGAAVDQRLGRVVGVAIPARAHDDVQPGRLRQPDEPARIPPDAGQREVEDRAAAGRPERRELLDDHGLVAPQLPVVPAVLDMPEGDRGVLVGQDPAEVGRVDGPADGLDTAAGDGHEAARSSRSASVRGGAASSRTAAGVADAAIRTSIRPRTRRSASERR